MANRGICSISGCRKPRHGRGWCAAHYVRWKTYGNPFSETPLAKKSRSKTGICSVPNCGGKHHARDFCVRHWERWRKHGDPLGGRASNGAPLQWIQQHVRYEKSDCLYWPFGLFDIRSEGRRISVLHVMCELAHGPSPSIKHEIAHSCGNGICRDRSQFCINPNHLRWATHLENTHDKFGHGTVLKGEQISSSKLTEEDVKIIRSLKGKMTSQEAANKIGVVNRRQVSRIWNRTRWGWLP